MVIMPACLVDYRGSIPLRGATVLKITYCNFQKFTFNENKMRNLFSFALIVQWFKNNGFVVRRSGFDSL